MSLPPDPADQVRDRLQDLVKLDGRTRVEIAAAAGIAPAHLYQVLSGLRKDPGVKTIAAILAALGKSWRDLDAPKPRKGG